MGDAGLSPRDFFSRHATSYARSESHARGADLARLVALVGPRRTETALDVGTGTGFTAMEVAPLVLEAVGLDITDEMLDEASRLARERGIPNVRFERGDACSIPFSDASFDIVTARRAAHHFADVPAFLREAGRVLRPGGRLGVADMSPIQGTEDFCNEIERLRDATHVRAFSAPEWASMVGESGLSLQAVETLSETATFEKWLSPVAMGGREEDAVRRAWRDAERSTKEALRLRDAPGEATTWTKTWVVLVARKG